VTNRTAELGPVSEEAGGAQRDEQHRGGQHHNLRQHRWNKKQRECDQYDPR